jgi:hypothetical protein
VTARLVALAFLRSVHTALRQAGRHLDHDRLRGLERSLRGVDLAKDEDPNILKSRFVRDTVERHPEAVPAPASFPTVTSGSGTAVSVRSA